MQGVCQYLTGPAPASFSSYSLQHTGLQPSFQQHSTLPAQGLRASCSFCLEQSFTLQWLQDYHSVQATAQRSPPQKGPLWLRSRPRARSFLRLAYTALLLPRNSVFISFSPSPFLGCELQEWRNVCLFACLPLYPPLPQRGLAHRVLSK